MESETILHPLTLKKNKLEMNRMAKKKTTPLDMRSIIVNAIVNGKDMPLKMNKKEMCGEREAQNAPRSFQDPSKTV